MRTSNAILWAAICMISIGPFRKCLAVEPTAVLVYFEGIPRAHLPAVFWYSGKSIPAFIKDERYQDDFVLNRIRVAPKFNLNPADYSSVVSLLVSSAGPKRSSYVLELLYEKKPPEVQYIVAGQFAIISEQLNKSKIKGHEILLDWPIEPITK